MKRYILYGVVALCTLPSCSVNILEEFADKTTNEALLFDAKQLINGRDYTAALAKFTSMTADFLAQREVKIVQASAYGGLCGINFISVVDAIDNIGSDRVFPWLMKTFRSGDATKQTNCIAAENLIKSISTLGASRTPDENLFMVFVALAKIGVILSRYGDSGTPNGVVDAGFDPCDVTDLPQAAAQEIATGFNIALDAFENIGSSTVGSDALDDVVSVCASLPPAVTLCSDPPQVNTSDIDATEEKGMRSILNESQSAGLGVCTGSVVACACP